MFLCESVEKMKKSNQRIELIKFPKKHKKTTSIIDAFCKNQHKNIESKKKSAQNNLVQKCKKNILKGE